MKESEVKMKKIIVCIMIAVLLSISVTFAGIGDDEVIVSVLNVQINNQTLNITQSDYPIAMYKHIIYLPLTYDVTKALGITLDFSAENGLNITSLDKSVQLDQEFMNSQYVPGEKINAQTVSYPVCINGQKIDQEKALYPFLNYRGVTYLPLTWEYAVSYFGWELSLKSGGRVNITTVQLLDPSEVNLVEPEKVIVDGVEQDVIPDGFDVDDKLLGKWYYVDYTPSYLTYTGLNTQIPEALNNQSIKFENDGTTNTSLMWTKGLIIDDKEVLSYVIGEVNHIKYLFYEHIDEDGQLLNYYVLVCRDGYESMFGVKLKEEENDGSCGDGDSEDDHESDEPKPVEKINY